MFDIKGKIALVTGAAVGIGASVVRTLLEEGIKHITILDIDEKNGTAIQEELNMKHGSNKVKFIKCDVTQKQELLNAFKTVKDEQGYIDVVINNAGIFNDNLYIKAIEINLVALVGSTLQAWDLMRKDEGGRGGTVINIASIAAINSAPVVPVYSGTKSAVVKFSTTLGDEVHYSRTGVRILVICFGVTDTPMTRSSTVKTTSFDSVIEPSIPAALNTFKLQTSEQAAKGLLEVFKKGESGSVWIVANGKPAVDFTEECVQHAKASEQPCARWNNTYADTAM